MFACRGLDILTEVLNHDRSCVEAEGTLTVIESPSLDITCELLITHQFFVHSHWTLIQLHLISPFLNFPASELTRSSAFLVFHKADLSTVLTLQQSLQQRGVATVLCDVKSISSPIYERSEHHSFDSFLLFRMANHNFCLKLICQIGECV